MWCHVIWLKFIEISEELTASVFRIEEQAEQGKRWQQVTNMTHMTIARQRLGKHIPNVTLPTIEGHSLLGNEPINTHSWKQKMVFSAGSVPRNYKRSQKRVQEESKEYKGVQRRTRIRMKRILVICEVRRLAIAL
jgi:hypothetical protein